MLASDHPPTQDPYTDDMALLVDAAYAAGGVALGWWKRDPKVWFKGTGERGAFSSPVSEADFAVDDYLTKRLRTARPHYGWLSEETADNPDRLSQKLVLIVDPIDGTRAFLDGSSQWTISLAIVDQGVPVAAALYRPATDTMFAAAQGHGATVDGRPFALVSSDTARELKVAGPGVYARALKSVGYGVGAHAYVPSLALRIAQAVDIYDLVFARPGASDWDIAAAHLILSEAGGILMDSHGQVPRYNGAEPRHGALIGGEPSLVMKAVEAVQSSTATLPTP